jgi:hypothetical protein
MSIEVQWSTGATASSLHAARAILLGLEPTDTGLADALAEPVERFRREVGSFGLAIDALLDHLIPLSTKICSQHELAEVAITKVAGQGQFASAIPVLARSIGAIERELVRVRPSATEPADRLAAWLQKQWNSHGQSLMFHIGQKTDPEFLAARAEVIPVQALIGGDGQSHLLYNSATIEAVSTDPTSELPEVLRIGWMLAQLNSEIPIWSETIEPRRLPIIAAMALIPATLAAAESAELAACNVDTINLAVEVWNQAGRNEAVAKTLWQWWSSYRASQTRWPVALGALDQLL